MSDVVFHDNSKRTKEELARVVDKILTEWGITAERNAKIEIQNDPMRVDTGYLRNSLTYAVSGKAPAIRTYQSGGTDKHGNPVDVKTGSYSGTAPIADRSGKAVYIGTNVKYGIYVHEGTQGGPGIPPMTPNRFIKNAIVNHKQDFRTIAENNLKG